MIKFTEEIKKFIIDNYKDITNTELAKKCSKKFNLDFNEDKIANFKSRLLKNEGINLRNAINGGRFIKGHETHNKGKKWSEYMSKKGMDNSRMTTFKKGNIPHNHRLIGSERETKDGYIEIKVKEPNKWQLKHRYLYEQQFGKIPKSSKLIFADGDRKNFNLNNLILISNAEELIMAQRKLFSNYDELTKSAVVIAKVIHRANKARKK